MIRVFGGNELLSSNRLFVDTIKKTKVLRKIAYISVIILLLLLLAFLSPIVFFSDNSDATAGTATASTLTFSFVNNKNTASVSVAVSSAEGNFATSTDSEKAEFRVSTNNATGYTLNLRTSSSTTALTSGTNTIASINATKTSNNFTINTYGLLPSKYNGTANTTNYYPASSTGFKMDETSAANTSPNTYTVGLGIKASYATPAGAYTNTTLIAEYVANAVNYSITYDKGNATGTPTNMPSSQSGNVSATSITLSSTVPVLTGYHFLGWCFGTVTTINNIDSCSGTVYNPNGNGTDLTFGIDQTISMNSATLHAMWRIALTITYNGNGLYFNNDSSQTTNIVKYDATSESVPYSEYYSHTSNINDAGVNDGTYSANLATKDVITVPGADSLHVTITYGTESNWDMLYVFQGEYTGDITRNMSQATTGWLYKYMGGNNNTTTVEIDIPGNTATFGFFSDNGAQYWGYYAVVYGCNSNGRPILTSGGTQKYKTYYDKTAFYGTFATPASTVGPYRFLGWSENANATTATYADEAAIIANAPYVNNDVSLTLYAIYQKGLTIRYNANSGTGTMSDQVIYAGETGTLSSNGFTAPSTHPYFKEWNTESNGSGSSYNEGSYFTAPANTTLGAVQNIYAIWERDYVITFHTSNAYSIVFNGVVYTDNQTTSVRYGTYQIYGNYGTRYAFSSWSATAGSFGNSSYQNTTYTVSDEATITLTGQYVNLAMQGMSSSNCTSTARPVYDNRDNTVYWIQELADGGCWMLDNLAFDLAANINTVTTSNTHVDANGINALKNGGSSPYSNSAISTTWNGSYNEATVEVSHKDVTLAPFNATSYTGAVIGAYGIGQNKTGVYYNFCAASAGTYCYDMNYGSSGGSTYDVCPSGWKMPATTSSYNIPGSFNYLYSVMSGNSNGMLTALSMPLSGYILSNGEYYRPGQYTYYWSTVPYNTVGIYSMFIRENSVYPQEGMGRSTGFLVRCVLQ